LSDHLIEIMDFVWRLSASFLSQLKLHLRLLERATLCARRYCATPKKPPTPTKKGNFVCSDVPSAAPFVAPFVVHMSLMARI
jgi:hypothetical protein